VSFFGGHFTIVEKRSWLPVLPRPGQRACLWQARIARAEALHAAWFLRGVNFLNLVAVWMFRVSDKWASSKVGFRRRQKLKSSSSGVCGKIWRFLLDHPACAGRTMLMDYRLRKVQNFDVELCGTAARRR